jgi:hypothetical protein
MAQSNPNGARLSAADNQEKLQDEIVWPHGHLLGYKVVDGKPLVLVPWYFTWELTDEFSREEVERVKRQYESQRLCKRRGIPPLKVNDGKSS